MIRSYLPGAPGSDHFDLECDTFKTTEKIDGIVTYLGGYTLTDSDQTPIMQNILLECGETNLVEHLKSSEPPESSGEMLDFWEDIFAIAKPLQKIHGMVSPGHRKSPGYRP